VSDSSGSDVVDRGEDLIGGADYDTVLDDTGDTIDPNWENPIAEP